MDIKTKKWIVQKWSATLPFLYLIIFLYVIYYGLCKFIDFLNSTNSDVAKAVIAGAVAIVIAIITQAFAKWYEQRVSILKEHRDKKIPIYEELISFFFSILSAEKLGKKPPSEKEIIDFLNKFTQKLIVWGSDEVIAKYKSFRNASIEAATNPQENMGVASLLKFETLLLAIRKDLGHKNNGLKRGDVLALHINDIEEVLGKIREDQ